jgi:hypothetical protein
MNANTQIRLYETVAEIDAACVKFHAKGQTLQAEAHKIACSVLVHVAKHGDIRVLAKFLASFPELSRVNAVRAWFEEFGPVTFEGNTPSFVRGKATRLGYAMETPFWKFKPEAEYQPVDVSKAIDSLIKKLARDAKETGINHSATIAALRKVPIEAGPNVPQMLMLEAPKVAYVH